MATCLDIITRAYRLGGNLRDADQALEAVDASVGLTELQSLILALPGMGHWKPVETAVAYTAGENERVRVTAAGATTITIPGTVSSDVEVLFCCNEVEVICEGYDDRAPKDGARVQVSVVSGGATGEATWFYCADLGEWKRADGLTLASVVPLNADMHLHLSAMLGLILAASEGLNAPPVTQALASDGMTKMRARYGKRQNVAADPVLVNPRNRYGYYR
jgi:hypothetical protein